MSGVIGQSQRESELVIVELLPSLGWKPGGAGEVTGSQKDGNRAKGLERPMTIFEGHT